MCNKKSSCGYYDNNILRNRLEITQKTYQTQRHSTSTSLLTIIYHMCLTPCRFLGLQVGYKIMGILLLMMLGWKVQRTQEYSLEKPEGLLWSCCERPCSSKHLCDAAVLNLLNQCAERSCVSGRKWQPTWAYTDLNFWRPTFLPGASLVWIEIVQKGKCRMSFECCKASV